MSQANNPFGFPGMEGAGAGNPLMQGLDLFSKAWGNLGSAGASPFAGGFKPEDLDRRIAELRVVENWLRVNHAMLQSTIQGLEVQRATIATLQSFAGAAGMGAPGGEAKPGAADPSAPMQAWWQMVQDQFGRIAQAATAPAAAAGMPAAGEQAGVPGTPPEDEAAAPARKTARKPGGPGRS